MSFDGIFTRAISKELDGKLVGGRIDKIYHPEKNELVLFVRSNRMTYKLYSSISSNAAGIYITNQTIENPANPSSFCMLLRKHLSGGIIESVNQYGWERIVEINVRAKDELGFDTQKKLIVEIMGKHSNITLVDSASMKIIDTIKRLSLDVHSNRPLLPGLIYQYPPLQQKISPDSIANNLDLLKNISSTSQLMDSIQGISPQLANELFYSDDIKWYEKLECILNKIENVEFCPVVYLNDENYPEDYYALQLEHYSRFYEKKFDSISEALEYYHVNKIDINRIRQKSSDIMKSLNRLIKKLNNKRQNLLNDINISQKAEEYKLFGELITANIYAFKDGVSEITVMNYYDNSEITIALDSQIGLVENAQQYYKKYNKAKRAKVEKQVFLEKANRDIEYLESIRSFVEMAGNTSTLDEIKNELIDGGFISKSKLPQSKQAKKNYSTYYRYKTKNGLDIYAGRNNVENDKLTFKVADKSDIWCHTKDIHGSHVILITGGSKPSDEDILEACEVAAFHSKAKNSSKVDVDFVNVKYVKKIPGARPGMVIFNNNKTLTVIPQLPKSIG